MEGASALSLARALALPPLSFPACGLHSDAERADKLSDQRYNRQREFNSHRDQAGAGGRPSPSPDAEEVSSSRPFPSLKPTLSS